MYHKILIALDATEADETILDHVTTLARSFGSSVVILHVADGWAARWFHEDAVSREIDADKAYLEKVRVRLTEQGLAVETELAFGDPAKEIIKWVDRAGLRSGRDVHARTPLHQRSIVRKHGQYSAAPSGYPGPIAESAEVKRLAVFLSFITATACAQTEPAFYKGADLSMVQALEYQGVRYRENGLPADPLAIFQEHGCNAVRLRLFVNPNGRGGQVNTLPYTLALARRVKKMGFHFLLDFHYSDRWADPGHQLTPAAWSGLSHEQLADRLFIYTRDTLAAFQQENCLPDMVQVGNEITDGMLAPDAWPLSDASNWGNFGGIAQRRDPRGKDLSRDQSHDPCGPWRGTRRSASGSSTICARRGFPSISSACPTIRY